MMAVEKEVDELIKYLGNISIISIRCHDYLDRRVKIIEFVELVDFATTHWDKKW